MYQLLQRPRRQFLTGINDTAATNLLPIAIMQIFLFLGLESLFYLKMFNKSHWHTTSVLKRISCIKHNIIFRNSVDPRVSVPSSELGPLSFRKRLYLPPWTLKSQGGGGEQHSLVGEGGTQFRRLERKPGTLYTQWLCVDLIFSEFCRFFNKLLKRPFSVASWHGFLYHLRSYFFRVLRTYL
jgi:hypothetical protein